MVTIYCDTSDPSQAFTGLVHNGVTYCGWCLRMVWGQATDHWCHERREAAVQYAADPQSPANRYRLSRREDGSIDYANAYPAPSDHAHTQAPRSWPLKHGPVPKPTLVSHAGCHCTNCLNMRAW